MDWRQVVITSTQKNCTLRHQHIWVSRLLNNKAKPAIKGQKIIKFLIIVFKRNP